MAEKKEVELKEEDRKLLKSVIERLDSHNAGGLPPSKHEESQGYKTIEEMLECPNCYPKVRDGVAKKEGFKPSIGKRDSKEYQYHCKGCGLNVKKDEKECPNCGSSEAY